MKIKKAIFAGSSAKEADKPALRMPEFAFIGRSNVGKSSLINALCGQNSLAHTSSTPGKTQCINHFSINDKWYLVDLPGYGYAKVGQKMRNKIAQIIDDYINNSQELMVLFVLLDCRHDLQKIDKDFLIRMGENGVPIAIIFTKGDKLGSNALTAQVAKNRELLLEYWEELPPIFITSSASGMGRDDLLDYIEKVLTLYQTI